MPLDQKGFLEEDIAKEEKEVAERESLGIVPKIPKWVPTNTPGYKPQYEYIPPKTYTPKETKKSTYTTKKGDTYTDIAEITGRAPGDIINAPGNPKNLRPGQILNIPALTGQNTAGVPPAQQYPVQTINQTRYADARQLEVQAQNDAWYIAHADEISRAASGLSPFARGPKADKIRAQMKALQQAYERTGTVGGRFMQNTAVGQALTSAGNWLVGGVKGELPYQQAEGPQPMTQAQYQERQAFNEGLTGRGALQAFSNFFNRTFTGWAPDYVPQNPETVGDVRQRQAIEARQQAMQEYYGTPVNPLEGTSVIPDTSFDRQFTRNSDGSTTVGNIPKATDVGGEQQAAELGAEIIETDYRGPNGTLNAPEGYVFYNGYMIRRDKFLDYLNSDAVNRDADYWQRQIFVRGMTKDIEAVAWALNKGDRDMLPVTLTPRHLENLPYVFGEDITGKSPAEVNAYVRDVLGYRWDANQQVWVKQNFGGTPNAAVVRGSGGGYSGVSRPRRRASGGGGGRSSPEEWSGAVDYGVDQSPVRPGFDQRYLNIGPGHLPVHWRM